MRWYQKWWGVVLIALGAGLLILLVVLLLITINYWLKLRSGEGASLQPRLQGSGFTAVGGSGQAAESINRQELETADSPFIGNPGAATTIVEFIDFKCPFCQQAAPIIVQVAQQHGHKVKIISRHFPAESIHPGATQLSEIAHCAHKQGRFERMKQVLFSSQNNLGTNLSAEDIRGLARLTGVDFDRLQTCLADPATAVAVRRDFADGIRFGVKGTPTFFVNGEKIEGVVPFQAWDGYLRSQ